LWRGGCDLIVGVLLWRRILRGISTNLLLLVAGGR
jgi:hypothetical protein